MSNRADLLDQAAARLSVEARGIDDIVLRYIDPASRRLPQAWVGPAADLLARDLTQHRMRLSGAAESLRRHARMMWIEAQALRAAAAVVGAEPPVPATIR